MVKLPGFGYHSIHTYNRRSNIHSGGSAEYYTALDNNHNELHEIEPEDKMIIFEGWTVL